MLWLSYFHEGMYLRRLIIVSIVISFWAANVETEQSVCCEKNLHLRLLILKFNMYFYATQI